MGMSMAGEKEPTQSKGTPVPANAFAQGIEKDLQKAMAKPKIQVKKNKGVAEAVPAQALGVDPKIHFLQPTIQLAEKLGYRVTLNPQGRVVAKLVNKQLGHIVHIGKFQPSGKGFEVSMADNLDWQTNAWSAKELAQDFKEWHVRAVKDQDFNNGYNERPQLEQQGVAEGQQPMNRNAVIQKLETIYTKLYQHEDPESYDLPAAVDYWHSLPADQLAMEFEDAIAKLKQSRSVTEDTGSWIVYDPKTRQIKKRFKTHTAGKSYAQTHKLGFASSEYYFDRVKGQEAVAESTNYWAKLQNERSTKLNNLVNELKENIK